MRKDVSRGPSLATPGMLILSPLLSITPIGISTNISIGTSVVGSVVASLVPSTGVAATFLAPVIGALTGLAGLIPAGITVSGAPVGALAAAVVAALPAIPSGLAALL